MMKFLLVISVIIFPITFDIYAGESSHNPESFKLKPPEDKGYLAHPLRIMNRSTYEAYNFNPFKGDSAKISYTVSKTGWVRLRLVRRDNKKLLLRTLQDWTHCRYGTTYEVGWDGRDSSGNIVDNKRIFILFEAKDHEDLKIHQSHSEKICRDPELKIVSHKAGDIISGKIVLVASFSFPGNPIGLDKEINYEGRLYNDHNLLHKAIFNKNQQGFSFTINTNTIKNGSHILTLNIDDYHDHIGTATVILNIQN